MILQAGIVAYEYQAEEAYTWMGWIHAGDRLIDTIKFEHYGDGCSFCTNLIQTTNAPRECVALLIKNLDIIHRANFPKGYALVQFGIRPGFRVLVATKH